MKKVMVRAWEIAREGFEKFGGKISEYLSTALAMAWAEIKKGVDKMKGSEKQIAWAENIKEEVIRHISKFNDLNAKENKDMTDKNALSTEASLLFGSDYKLKVKEIKEEYKLSRKERALETPEEKKARREAQAQAVKHYEESLIQEILAQDEASYWIDRFKFLA